MDKAWTKMRERVACFFPIVRYQAEIFVNIADYLIQINAVDKVVFMCSSSSSYLYVRNRYETLFIPEILLGESENIGEPPDYYERMFHFEARKLNIQKAVGSEKHSDVDLLGEATVLDRFWSHFFNKYNVERLYVWNGYILPQQMMLHHARKMRVNCLFFENGYEPNTVAIDSKGINAKSSFESSKESRSNHIVTQHSFPVKLKQQRNQFNSLYSRMWSLSKRSKYKGLLRYEFTDSLIKRIYCILIKPLADQNEKRVESFDNYVFFPMQVITDSQLIINAAESQEDIIDAVVKIIDDINERLDQKLVLVIKEHPKQESTTYYEKLRNRVVSPNVVFMRTGNTNKLIENSRAVITINSSVGYLALKKYKNVFVLGDSIYSGEGLGIKVRHYSKMRDMLIEIISNNKEYFDRDVVDQFIKRYKSYVVPIKYNKHSTKNH